MQALAAAPLDLTAAVDTPEPARWLALLGLAEADAAASIARPGRLVLNATGTPRTGLTTFAELRGDQNAFTA
ncbi:hypothetical protein ABTM16_20285, partial [Acinetobacter baumannii]